jgi:hypothetical protein
MDRKFLKALVYEKDDSMNLSQLFMLIFGLIGGAGVLYSVVVAPWLGLSTSVAVQIASYSFLSAAYISVMIGSIPIARAKILAESKVPGEVARAVASITNVERSSDMSEVITKEDI